MPTFDLKIHLLTKGGYACRAGKPDGWLPCTVDPGQVTCKRCRISTAFKDRLARSKRRIAVSTPEVPHLT